MPHLIAMFETNFSVKLTDESNSIREVLGQIDTILFRAYVDPISMHLDTLVREGISSPSWVPKTSRPLDARTYVYNVLIALVLVHTEAYTTATPLTAPILKHLLESLSNSLINTFKQRPKYNLPSLMQATLDVEFLAQTLNNYTTDKASNTQSAIYVALDERTDNDARLKLQQELQEMRSILKKLREGTRTEL
jgi:exocyst complex component 2